MSKRTVDKSEGEIISYEFAKRFSQWELPVDDMDSILKKMPRESRQTHYRQLGEILERSAFHKEIDEWRRKLTRTLAMSDGLTDTQKQGLKQTLVAVEDFVIKITERSLLHEKLQSLKPQSSKI